MERVFRYEVMGTVWSVSLYEQLEEGKAQELEKKCREMLEDFDKTYSRFKEESLITKITKNRGVYEVPEDLITMLRMYKSVYNLSGKRFTPCIGGLLEDIGYDQTYSLKEKTTMRDVPDFDQVVILDATHIETKEKILFDIGAVGKGYCVDLIANYLRKEGYTHFLVDGSGDVFYEGNTMPIRVGLEHPNDTTRVIGVIEMTKGAMCSSATNRRAWGKYSHYIDPHNKTSPEDIVATWVIADTTAYADLISSLLFFVAPETITEQLREISFSYCIMNKENKIKKSQDFSATFF